MSKYIGKVQRDNIFLLEDKKILNDFYNFLEKEKLQNKFSMKTEEDTLNNYIKKVNSFFIDSTDGYIKDLIIESTIKRVEIILQSTKESEKNKITIINDMYKNINKETIEKNVDLKILENMAIDKNNRFLTKEFLKNGYSLLNNSQILITSIHSGDKEMFDLAISNGANVNGPKNPKLNRETPLGWKPSHLVKDRDNIHLYMIDKLIKNGADINRFINTPNHYLVSAVSSKDKHLVETLIKKGAKIDVQWDEIKMKDYFKKHSPDFYNLIYNNNQKNKQINLKI